MDCKGNQFWPKNPRTCEISNVKIALNYHFVKFCLLLRLGFLSFCFGTVLSSRKLSATLYNGKRLAITASLLHNLITNYY